MQKRKSIYDVGTNDAKSSDKDVRKRKQQVAIGSRSDVARAVPDKRHSLIFEDGSAQFRLRLAVSILSHRPLLIRNIRSDDVEAPGLREHEASFLRLLDRMTNGSVIEINSTGTQLRFKPGVLTGGTIDHTCPTYPFSTAIDSENDKYEMSPRSIGWYLEGILPLACFGKESLDLTLRGITDGACQLDPSVDYIKTSILPLLNRFGIGSNEDFGPPPNITVLQRFAPGIGATNPMQTPSLNGGCVKFYCPIVKELKSLDFTEMGKMKRVRGTVVSLRIPPTSAARVAHAAKGMLHRLLPDVWIHTDAHTARGNKQGAFTAGPNPALSICLAAESTSGVVLVAETCLDAKKQRDSRTRHDSDSFVTPEADDSLKNTSSSGVTLPEDLGTQGTAMLLEEVRRGGCIDTGAQSTAFLLMCVSPEDVSRIRVGKLSSYSISSLRLFKTAFDVEFKVKTDEESKTIVMSCLGSGYRNMAKAST